MQDRSFADGGTFLIPLSEHLRLCKGGGGATPPTPPLPPSQISAAENLQKNTQRQASLNRKGFASTVLTSGMGVTTPGPTQTKTLLGE